VGLAYGEAGYEAVRQGMGHLGNALGRDWWISPSIPVAVGHAIKDAVTPPTEKTSIEPVVAVRGEFPAAALPAVSIMYRGYSETLPADTSTLETSTQSQIKKLEVPQLTATTKSVGPVATVTPKPQVAVQARRVPMTA